VRISWSWKEGVKVTDAFGAITCPQSMHLQVPGSQQEPFSTAQV